jgi:hypothetical protein
MAARLWRLWVPAERLRHTLVDSDFNLQFVPWLNFAYNSYRNWQVPLWNPHLNAGQPGLADMQMGALYPLHLLSFAVLAAQQKPFTAYALQLLTTLDLILASLLAYLLATRYWSDRRAGLVSGCVYAFSGYAYGSMTAIPTLHLVALLPLVLLTLDWALRVPHLRRFALSGSVLGMAVLAGHPQWLLYATTAGLVYGLTTPACGGRASNPPLQRPAAPARLRFAGLATWLAVGAGVGAVQWLPTLEMIRQSQRVSDVGYAFNAGGLPPAEVLGIGLPGLTDPLLWLEPISIGLAALAVWKVALHSRPWLGVGAVALLTTLGGHTAFYGWLYLLVPAYAFIRDQQRAAFALMLALAVLAGGGVLVLLGGLGRKLGPAGGHRRQILLAASLAMVAAQVTLLTIPQRERLTRAWPSGGHYPVTPIIERLKADPGPGRVSSEGHLPGGPNSAAVYGLEDVLGYTPLGLQTIARLEALERSGLLPELKRLGMLNVRYLLTERDLSGDGRLALLGQSGSVRLYGVGGAEALPRAWLTFRAEVVTAEDEAQHLAQLDLSRVTLLPHPPPLPLGGDGHGTATIEERGVSSLSVRVDADAVGLLVLSEVYYPGWRAWVDGRPTEVLRANSVLRAVAVPPGHHQVVLRYRPRSFTTGAIVTLLSLACLAALTGAEIRTRYRLTA